MLLAASQRWGAIWSLTAGLFALTVYLTFYVGGFPLHSYFNTPFRPPAALAGVVAWATLVAFVWTTLRRRRPLDVE